VTKRKAKAPPPGIETTPSGGRPLKYPSVEKLAAAVEAYFRECDREEDSRVFEHGEERVEEIPYIDEKTNRRKVKKRIVCETCRQELHTRGCTLVSGELKVKKPYTTTGLAVWLDTSRQTLLNYEIKPEFFDTILKAKQRIENSSEEKLFDRNVPTKGVTFSLSNNHQGWVEKIETKVEDKRDAVKDLTDALFAQAATRPDTEVDAQPARTVNQPEGVAVPGGDAPVPAVLRDGAEEGALPVPAAGGLGDPAQPAGQPG
jgi:hypothetical protein